MTSHGASYPHFAFCRARCQKCGRRGTRSIYSPSSQTGSCAEMLPFRAEIDAVAQSEGFPLGGFRLMVALAACALAAPFLHVARSETARACLLLFVPTANEGTLLLNALGGDVQVTCSTRRRGCTSACSCSTGPCCTRSGRRSSSTCSCSCSRGRPTNQCYSRSYGGHV